MSSGVLFLDAGELLVATRAIERHNPAAVSRKDARTVVGLLESGQGRTTDLLRKWKERTAMDTATIEAQDLEVSERIYFSKQDEIHVLRDVTPSPDEPGYLRLTFDGWHFDASPTEAFQFVLD